MSLFGGKKETIHEVEISTSKLLEKHPQNYLIGNMVKAILDGGDLTFSITRSAITGPSANIRRYYNYGKSSYYYRLPTVNTSFSFLDYGALVSVLETITGTSVIISDAYQGTLTSDIYAKVFLYKSYGMNPLTQIVVIGGLSFRYSSVTGNQIILVSTAGDYTGSMSYRYITMPSPPSGNWYIAFYTTLSSPSVIRYFEYRVNSGTYELLDNKAANQTDDALPIAVIRTQFQTITTSHPAYPTTKRLLNTINVRINDIVKGINSNKDIGSVNNTFFLFSTMLNSNKSLSKRYIYFFFKSLSAFMISNVTTEQKSNYSDMWENNDLGIMGYTSHLVSDQTGLYYEISEATYKYKLKIGNITSKTVNGSIGRLRHTNVTSSTSSTSGAFYAQTTGTVTIQYQVSASQYEVLTITGLSAEADIPQTNNRTQQKVIGVDDTDSFIIPFIPSIVWDNFTLKDQEAVIYDAMLIVVYAAVSKKVKSGGFFSGIFGKLLLAIVGSFAFSFIMTGTFPVFSTVLRQAVINVAMNMVVEQVLAPLLGKNVAILALALGAMSIATGMFTGGGSLSFSDVLLKSIEAVSKAITINTQVMLQQGYEELMELSDLTKSIEEQIEEIKDMQQDKRGLIDPFMLITKRGDRYYKDTGGFIKNALKTPLDLVQDSKNGFSNFKLTSVDPWSSLPSFL